MIPWPEIERAVGTEDGKRVGSIAWVVPATLLTATTSICVTQSQSANKWQRTSQQWSGCLHLLTPAERRLRCTHTLLGRLASQNSCRTHNKCRVLEAPGIIGHSFFLLSTVFSHLIQSSSNQIVFVFLLVLLRREQPLFLVTTHSLNLIKRPCLLNVKHCAPPLVFIIDLNPSCTSSLLLHKQHLSTVAYRTDRYRDLIDSHVHQWCPEVRISSATH